MSRNFGEDEGCAVGSGLAEEEERLGKCKSRVWRGELGE